MQIKHIEMDDYLVSARKYRPVSFDAVVGQPSVTGTLRKAVLSGQIAHAYLFCGPRGVGKTTCARILARTLNCLSLNESGESCGKCESCKAFNESRSYNIHELDAASNNSVEDIRSLIEKVRVLPQVGKYSIYIIDEVHMLSQSAFNAFLKTLEEPPRHAVFILATTEKHKILPTILSRCQIFDFNRIRVEDIMSYLMQISDARHIEYEKEALHVVSVKADGSMRDALSIFDQLVSFSGSNITFKEVSENLNILDYEYYFKITDAFIKHSVSDALILYNEILLKGFDGFIFIGSLSAHLRDLLVSLDNDTVQLLETSDSLKDRYINQAAQCNSKFLFKALEICNLCEVGYKSSKNQRLHVELALIRMCSLDTEKKNLNSENDRSGITDAKASFGNKNKQDSQPDSKYSNTGSSKTTINEQHRDYIVSGQDVSIRDALKAKKVDSESKDNQPEQPKKEPENDKTGKTVKGPVSGEFLLMCWNSYIETIREDRPRMAVALNNTNPKISNDHIIGIVLSNQAQLEDFNRNTKGAMEKFLQREIQNDEIVIDAGISDLSRDKSVKLYTSDEKFEYLNKKNPLLSELKEKLNLELE